VKHAVAQRAWELGFDLCRFTTAAPPESAPHLTRWLAQSRHGGMAYLERQAPKRLDPQQVLPGARSLIVVATNYAVPEDVSPQATHVQARSDLSESTRPCDVVARYARHTDYHEVMGRRLEELCRFLQNEGGPDTRCRWYVDTGPVLERDFAQRAGVGFIGKHTNLISRRFGNWLLLGEILTTLEFEPDPPEHNRCGSCTRCLRACPTGAIVAPFELDARRCISYLTIEHKGSIPLELRPALGKRIFGCDDCLAVCPWNRFAREARLMQTVYRPELAAPDLIELLALEEATFKRRFAGTPLLRAKRRGLLRNVCVALGNLADPTARPALQRAARDPEPLIAEHARWALERMSQPNRL